MGILGGLLKAIPIVGDIASGIAGGMAKGREQESQQLLTQDQLRNQQYNTAQHAQMQAGGLDLQRKGFTEDARGGRAKQALIASILGEGFTPTQVSVPGVKTAQVSGGLAASLKNPGAQQAMQELMRQALLAQLNPDTFTGGSVLTPPALSKMPKASWFEKLMGGAGIGGSLVGGINEARGGR